MTLEVQDRVCDQLSWTVESRLPSSERFVELGSSLGEICSLLGRDGADLSSAAGVDWMELGCEDCWRDGSNFGWFGFVGEEARGETVL